MPVPAGWPWLLTPFVRYAWPSTAPTRRLPPAAATRAYTVTSVASSPRCPQHDRPPCPARSQVTLTYYSDICPAGSPRAAPDGLRPSSGRRSRARISPWFYTRQRQCPPGRLGGRPPALFAGGRGRVHRVGKTLGRITGPFCPASSWIVRFSPIGLIPEKYPCSYRIDLRTIQSTSMRASSAE